MIDFSELRDFVKKAEEKERKDQKLTPAQRLKKARREFAKISAEMKNLPSIEKITVEINPSYDEFFKGQIAKIAAANKLSFDELAAEIKALNALV